MAKRPEDISPHHSACRHCATPEAHESAAFVFGVDLDGVCADFYEGLRPIAAEWMGRRVEDLPTNPSFGLPEWNLPLDQGGYSELHRFAVNQKNLFGSLKPMEGAPQALRTLSHLGVRIRIVTHRFFIARSHEQAASQTVRWLEEHDIPYWDLCFMERKQDVECDAYVDDSLKNITSVQKRFDDDQSRKRSAILFSSKGEAPPKGAVLARDWPTVKTLVTEAFTQWERREQRAGKAKPFGPRRAKSPVQSGGEATSEVTGRLGVRGVGRTRRVRVPGKG
jgi:hypothetical protein